MGCKESKQEAKAEEMGEGNEAADNVEQGNEKERTEQHEQDGDNQNNTNSNVNGESKEGM